MRAAIAMALAVSSATAHAESAAAPDENRHEEKHASTGIALALGGTAAGVGMFFLGKHTDRPELMAAGGVTAFAAPSFGRWYAGDPLTAGMALRAGAAVVGFAALAMVMQNRWPEAELDGAATALGIVAGGLYVGGAAYDIATTPAAVERHNTRRGISISPTVSSSGGGPSGFGLSIGGSF